MEGRLMGFIIWGVVGILFILMGIYKICSKKTQPFGFWANAEVFPVNDVKAYNKALGKLWIVFGIIFIVLGIPLLAEQNAGSIAITIVGILFLSITTMIVYVIKIEGRYRKN